MKELSIEEKAKAYDEAKARMSIAYNSNRCTIGFMNEIFPELKESEDERIRKEIMDFIDTNTIDSDERRDRWFSYLEKHKPISFTSLEDRKVKMSLMQYISKLNQDVVHLHPGIETCNEWIAWLEKQGEKLPVGFYYVNSEGKKFYSDMFKYGDITLHVKNQNEQKSFAKYKVGDTIYYNSFGRLVSFVIANIVEDGTDNPMYEDKDGNSVFQNDIVEQKPADKVKPKFHEGDWAVSNLDGKARQISEVHFDEYNSYYVVDGKSVNLEEYDRLHHLWTIQDAKGGDILFHSDSASNGTFIFKELLKYEFSEKVICYCDYDSEDHFCLGEHHTCCWADAKILHPASKEQRDLLFSKMKEAGYVWDAEKKELKKI